MSKHKTIALSAACVAAAVCTLLTKDTLSLIFWIFIVMIIAECDE